MEEKKSGSWWGEEELFNTKEFISLAQKFWKMAEGNNNSKEKLFLEFLGNACEDFIFASNDNFELDEKIQEWYNAALDAVE